MENIIIRPAVTADAKDLLEIYAPYVLTTPITFEVSVPTLADFQNRIETIRSKFPYFVAVSGNKIVGYTYASSFKGRAAYDWSVETSIYVADTCRGKGIGQQLYQALEDALKKQHIHNVCACITYPNNASISFHESFGFETVAHFHKSGYKFDSWHDMIWMEKFICEHEDKPPAFIPYPELSSK